MMPIAMHETLRELDEDTRLAWAKYTEALQELSGVEYERAEAESWDVLQSRLRDLDARRALVAAG